MSDEIPSAISHISVGTNDLDRAVMFYDSVLMTLGCQRILEHPGGVAWGREYPEFWVMTPFNGEAATVGNGSHVAFMAFSEDQVIAFYRAALAAGGTDDGPPGPRPAYGDAFFGCYVRDLDGNKIEATFWDESKLEDA